MSRTKLAGCVGVAVVLGSEQNRRNPSHPRMASLLLFGGDPNDTTHERLGLRWTGSNILEIPHFCGSAIRSCDFSWSRTKIAVATLSQQRPFNQRYVSSIVRWHRIPVVLTPPIGGVNIILTFFWIDLRSVFDVTQKREPIFFWHVSRRYSLKWMIVSHNP